MQRFFISLILILLIIIPISAVELGSESLVLHMDFNSMDSHMEFGISESEPYFKDGSLVCDDIGEIHLDKEERGGELIESTVLYPYWILVLSEDVDIEISGDSFKRKSGNTLLSFDWRGELRSSSNDKDIASDDVVIGLDGSSADYGERVVYSHRASSGLKSMSYVPMTIRTQNIASYPAGAYEAEIIMKLIKN